MNADKALAWRSTAPRFTPCGVEKVEYLVEVSPSSVSYSTLATAKNWMRLPATAAHVAILLFNTDGARSLDWKVQGALSMSGTGGVPRMTEILAQTSLAAGVNTGIIQLPDAIRFFWVPTKMTIAGAAVSAELQIVVW